MTRRNRIEHVPRCLPNIMCKICNPSDPPVQTPITMFACTTCGRTIDPGKDVHVVDDRLRPFCATCPIPSEEDDDFVEVQRPPAQGHQVEGGRKDDRDKARYDLIPPVFLDQLAQALTYGANKYGDRNWEKGIKVSRYFAALMRHMWAYWRGEDNDPESGLSHLAHASACLAMMTDTVVKRNEYNDRP